MNQVTLFGGPRDGQVLTFAHGDTIEFPASAPAIDFSVPTTDPIRYETFLYRRSLRNPSIFVFQP